MTRNYYHKAELWLSCDYFCYLSIYILTCPLDFTVGLPPLEVTNTRKIKITHNCSTVLDMYGYFKPTSTYIFPYLEILA